MGVHVRTCTCRAVGRRLTSPEGMVQGEICDIDGNCVDAADDEVFKLTTKGGKLTVEVETVTTETDELDAGLIFEQDPVQIIDALLPLYLNSTLLRSLQVKTANHPRDLSWRSVTKLSADPSSSLALLVAAKSLYLMNLYVFTDLKVEREGKRNA